MIPVFAKYQRLVPSALTLTKYQGNLATSSEVAFFCLISISFEE